MVTEIGTAGGGEYQEELSFEQMLEESLSRARVTLEKGDRVRGTVVGLRSREAIIDLGAKREAMLNLDEITNAPEPRELKVGDEVEGTIVDEGSEGEPARLTTQVPGGRLGRQYLAEAKREGRTINGVVRGYNRGGLEVQIGGVRAFCPMSQIDARPPEDLSQFVGQRMAFKVHDLRGRQVVVSRRSLLDEERSAKAAETLAGLQEGATITGTIASLHDFGAFVDIGGVDALLPTSEVTRRRISRPADVLKPGQEVTVAVLKVDLGDGKRRPRVTVSLKALEADPWEAAREWLVEGAAFRGKIVGIQPFGVFVELVPGVDGLIHISDLAGGARVKRPEDLVSVGQELDVQVGPIDWENRRVSLAPLVPIEEQLPPPEQPQGEGGGGFGTLGDILTKE